MFRQATETYLLWLTLTLAAGLVISLLVGIGELTRARGLPFFMLRRQALERGWRSLLLAVVFLLIGLAVNLAGKPVIELVITPTFTPTISPTPSLTPTMTLTPSLTLPPTDTLTPSPTFTPSLTPTPGFPASLVTPIPSAVPGNADAAFSPITVATGYTRTFQPIGASFEFDAAQLSGKLFAIYTFNNMNNGAQVSVVWYREGQPIHVSTELWAYGPGGYGAADCGLDQCRWEAGHYRVAIFVDNVYKQSADFVISGAPPTRTATPTNTATNTLTATATPSRTPIPTRTP